MPRTVICSEFCIKALLDRILSLDADPRCEQRDAARESRALRRLGHGIDVLAGSRRLLRGAAYRFGTDDPAHIEQASFSPKFVPFRLARIMRHVKQGFDPRFRKKCPGTHRAHEGLLQSATPRR